MSDLVGNPEERFSLNAGLYWMSTLRLLQSLTFASYIFCQKSVDKLISDQYRVDYIGRKILRRVVVMEIDKNHTES